MALTECVESRADWVRMPHMINDLALLGSRVMVGASLFAHGAQKGFGWFEGPGPDGAAGFMESLDLKPGRAYAQAASTTEMAAGILIALGLGGAAGPAMGISTMIVAAATVHAKNGYFMSKNGAELNAVYSAAGLAFAGGGFGRFSFDEMLGLGIVRKPWFTALALTGGVVGALAILAQRTSDAAAEAAASADPPDRFPSGEPVYDSETAART